MARYVAQCKYFDQLKQNEDLCIQAFKTGKYLMFSDGKPLLNISDKAGTLSIKLTSFTGIKLRKNLALLICFVRKRNFEKISRHQPTMWRRSHYPLNLGRR